MAWNPSDQETYVFRSKSDPLTRIVLLVPKSVPNPPDAIINGELFEPDPEMTEQTRMHVRVSNRKRGLAD